MPPLTPAFSVRIAARSSSPKCIRSPFKYQHVRYLRHDVYADRKAKADQWLLAEGERYRRPVPGETNYISRRNPPNQAFNLKDAARGQEGGWQEYRDDDAGEFDQAAKENPEAIWEDVEAVAEFKSEFDISDDQIASYRQRFPDITPDILSYALKEDLKDDQISKILREEARVRANLKNESFYRDRAERAQAEKRLADDQGAQSQRQSRQRKEFLRPFPLNPQFHSQPVLSEELREVIYLKVVRDKMSVRTVSTLMKVSMERVGAVVRMKQMERDWLKEVSSSVTTHAHSPLILYDDSNSNRLVFKTPTWLQNSFASLSDQTITSTQQAEMHINSCR